jgi:glycosyltransferase involved in cell wall biosynthesis
MRIALVGPYPADPRRFGGGVETAFFNLVQGLSLLDDLEIHALTFARGAESERRADTDRAAVHYLPGRARLNSLTFHRGDRAVLRRALDVIAPDVIHAQEALGYGYVCLKVASGEPVIVTIHGVAREAHRYVTRTRHRIQGRLAAVPLETYCVRHAAYLIQPTRYPQAYFGTEIRGNIVAIDNPVADSFFRAEPAPEPGRVLFAGGITPGKRLLDVVEALARVRSEVPSISLRVASAASDPAYGTLVADRVSELRLESVELLGALSSEEMIEEYRRASVLVLPSAQETSPIVIGEAMAVGMPVIATRVGGVPSLVEDDVTGYLFDVGDVSSLTRLLTEVLTHEDKHRSMAVAARDVAETRFRPRLIAERTRALYERAFREAQRPGP